MSEILRAYWSHTERDLMFRFPRRSDGHYLSSRVLTKEVTDELERRGYDLTTLRFSIAQKREPSP